MVHKMTVLVKSFAHNRHIDFVIQEAIGKFKVLFPNIVIDVQIACLRYNSKMPSLFSAESGMQVHNKDFTIVLECTSAEDEMPV